MNKVEKYNIKDRILNSLANSDNQFATLAEISERLQIGFEVICTLSDELIEDKFLENRGNLTAKKREWHGDKMVLLSQKGKYLVVHEGGYTNKLKEELKLDKKVKSELNLNRVKLKTDVAKNLITIIIAVIGGLYTAVDFIGSIISDNFDLARSVLSLFK